MKTQRKKHSRLWVYLLYLGLVTSLILSVTLARYASGASGTGTATVAAVAGDMSILQPETIEMPLEGLTPGGEARSLTFKVVNYGAGKISEVALDYDVTVTTTNNLPLAFTLTAQPPEGAHGAGKTVDGAGAVLGETTARPDGKREQTLTGGAFPLAETGQTHTYTLTVTWPDEESGKTKAEYADEIDLVTVAVEARQRLSGDTASGG